MDKGKVVVFGGGGFIGSHLCEELLKAGYRVVIFEKLNFSRRNISSFISSVEIIEGDFSNEIDLKRTLKGTDYVFHLVSSTLPANSNENTIYDVETNVVSTLKLLNEVIAAKIRKLIFISSGGTVYGIPSTLPIKEEFSGYPICSYGIVKRTIEHYLYLYKWLYNLDYYVFRLSNPYGERQNPNLNQGAISVFLWKMLQDKEIEIWGDGTITRDYIYIKDAVEVFVKSLQVSVPAHTYNVGSGRGITLNELLRVISEVSGIEPKVVYKKGRKIDVPVNILDITHIKKDFQWSPKTRLEEGIQKTIQYYKDIL
ncbi:MAG: NAD-dependent epimerase/dehydratase family protein [Ignavibacteria bacterium]